jgi:glutamate racemase
MSSHAEKCETFSLFLQSVYERLQPDRILVACHTLSTLLPEIQLPPIAITGMQASTQKLVKESSQQFGFSKLLVLATSTTVQAQFYEGLVSETHAVACVGLADLISSDAQGDRVKGAIRSFLHKAQHFREAEETIGVLLGCTHYGWREDLFGQVLNTEGWQAHLINPNREIASDWQAKANIQTIRVCGAYPTPSYEKAGLTSLLQSAGLVSLQRAFAQESVLPLFA